MIDYIIGKVKNIKNGSLTLEANNIGYNILIPQGSIASRENEEIKVYTYLVHKEDSMTLYGFGSELEKEVFINLISVGGVGPKSAISILSKENIETIISLIAGGDEKVLSSVPGIWTKTAKKIIIELKEKFKNLAAEKNIGDIKKKDSKQEKRLIEALFSLGYKKGEAKEIIEKIEIKEDLSDEEYLKIILREISSKN